MPAYCGDPSCLVHHGSCSVVDMHKDGPGNLPSFAASHLSRVCSPTKILGYHPRTDLNNIKLDEGLYCSPLNEKGCSASKLPLCQ